MIDWTETQKQFNRTDLSGRRPKVSVRCDLCNKLSSKVINNKSDVKNGKYDWICKSCSVKKQWKDGHFKNHSSNMQKRWEDKNYKAIFQSDKFKQKKKEQSKEIWSNKQLREYAKQHSRDLWDIPEFRKQCINSINKEKKSKITKKLWESLEYRNKVISAGKKYFTSDEHKKKSMLTIQEVIERAVKLHGEKYDYSLSEYKGYSEKIDIICPIHGKFSQRVINHLQGCGCPKCPKSTSLQEKEVIDFIKSVCGYDIICNDRSIISPYELDIVIPNLKLAIEYNGNYWHSYNRKESKNEIMKHSIKCDLCFDNGYQLIQITENEWKHKNDIVKSRLKYLLGKTNQSIYARKCKIININKDDYHNFIDVSHLQGHKNASVKYGLEYNNELVAAISFNKHPKHQWEITRFVNKLESNVVGGASKLFKHFLREHNPDQILTYADRRYSNGNLYKKLGFRLDGITQPNYCYINKDIIFSRQQFQKHKLSKRLDHFDPNLTEAENMFNNGYRRMWDAGNYRFLYK